MLPHGAQGSWEGSAIYLAKERRHADQGQRRRPGYTATDFNTVRAGEVADFKSGAPAAGRGCPTARAESLGRSLRLTRGLVVAQALLATRLPGHCPRNSSAPAAVDHPIVVRMRTDPEPYEPVCRSDREGAVVSSDAS
jgi:hypothetical protein